MMDSVQFVIRKTYYHGKCIWLRIKHDKKWIRPIGIWIMVGQFFGGLKCIQQVFAGNISMSGNFWVL